MVDFYVYIYPQAQTTVKQAKEQYDKLKDDVTEKISMLNASRSSLLSRSLPSYQEAALEFFENASQELQTVLNGFKSSHHHQYRIKSEAEGEEEEEEGFEEELKSPLTTTHAIDSEDDTENDQPLLDLASSDDQEVQTKEQEILTAYHIENSYQVVGSFSHLKTVQMDDQPANSDSLNSLTDDTMWSKLLISSTEQTVVDEAATDLNLFKINPSPPLIPEASSTITPHSTPATSSSSASVLHSLTDYTSSSPKLRDNWDELFADLDPLSNEKV